MHSSRRAFLAASGTLLSFVVGGAVVQMTAREAHAAALPLRKLSAGQGAMLDLLAEALVPGSREAGVVQFIDSQLAASADDSLLMLKYLGVPTGDYLGFYTSALDSAIGASRERYAKPVESLAEAEVAILLDDLNGEPPASWQGPPPGFFLFALRSDACDVVYGTQDGFKRLGIPYAAHLAPARPW